MERAFIQFALNITCTALAAAQISAQDARNTSIDAGVTPGWMRPIKSNQ